MIDRNHSQPSLRYIVSVGHARVTVDGCSRNDALLNARRMLSQDMPRLYDVIWNMEDSQFQVDHDDS